MKKQLVTYQKKRRFDITKEPSGEASQVAAEVPKKKLGKEKLLSFVVQRHDATRLHFDFRLELDGVLKSWAVPKGPSMSPSDKRLAVEVEDHPLDYGTFEGAIPHGEYGGGHVLVWDHGSWAPVGDAHQGLAKGHLVFDVLGQKIKGRFALIRMKGTSGKTGVKTAKNNWLLLKEKDPFAIVEKGAADVTEAAAPPELEGIHVQLATLDTEVPKGKDWIYELKLDGYRALSSLHQKKSRIISRNGIDWTRKLAPVTTALEALPIESAIFDGELCVLDDAGVPSFQLLQNALSGVEASRLLYAVFDVLFLDGFDVRDRPLLTRKAMLHSVLAKANPPLLYWPHVDAHGPQLLEQAKTKRYEGIVAKRADRPHHDGRSKEWIKVKCGQRQEFVIVGSTQGKGHRESLGALLLGVSEADGFRYVGKVGSGFSGSTLTAVKKELDRLEEAPPPRGAPRLKDARWVAPELVCEVSFQEWTEDGALRHPVFLGLRVDKAAGGVVREGDPGLAKTDHRASAARKPEVGGIIISHPERVLDSTSGLTKLDLARYLEAVSDQFLPYAKDRPISLVRSPDGDRAASFFQKQRTPGMPKSIHGHTVGEHRIITIDDAEGLVSLAQFGTTEVHAWGSRYPHLDLPDWIVMDLDPDEDLPFSKVIDAAESMRETLRSVKLESFVKTTGGKGLHVVAPIVPVFGWDQVKTFTHSIAAYVENQAPKSFTSNMAKKQRKGRIFIDYLRNGDGATAVLPYSPRNRPGLTVAMPIDWKDLRSVNPKDFTIQTVPQLLSGRKKDPWADFFRLKQRIPDALGALHRAS